MIRDILCKRCNEKIGQEETVKTTVPKLGKLCTECKTQSLALHKLKMIERNQGENIRKSNSDRMKKKNPMQNEEYKNKMIGTMKEKYASGEIVSVFSDPIKYAKIREKWKMTPEGRKSISDRMKTKNPMTNSEYKEKMVTTFKNKVQSGEIVYKHGPEHHLWKGNRTFADTVRCQLYKFWTYECLKRDNFTCQKCNSNTNLTVHHLKPLRDFISIAKEKFQIKDFSKINSDLWQPYIDFIIDLHTLDVGITVCKTCHSDIDDYYFFKQD